MVNRLIVDAPARGSWNMAVDEALFQSAVAESTILRLYQWSEPTLSLGYFQRAVDRQDHLPSRGLPLVRRSTGGGAIVHDRELTYSFVTQLPDERPVWPRSLMSRVHDSLATMLNECGVAATICAKSEESTSEPFLCFARHALGDILIAQDKVVGSAQRRHRRVLLQHGSILLSRSTAAPELPGISELAACDCHAATFIERWPARLRGIFPGEWLPSALSRAEQELAERIESERFANERWNLKR